MKAEKEVLNRSGVISRRKFFKFGGAAVAGGALSMYCSNQGQAGEVKIIKHKTLGRTKFQVSDISLGCVGLSEVNIVRYMCDRGVNYIDTAESYGNGEAERIIGTALKNLDRNKLFITSKIRVSDNDTEQTVIERFRKCQERMGIDMIDAFYMHGVTSIAALDHAGFHAAINTLKTEGRVRFTGISCHGPGRRGDSMEKVCIAAAEDGRFDMMIFIYNFMNTEESDKIIAACKKNNVGTTAMKTAAGQLKPEPFDPENPTEGQAAEINRSVSRGRSREQAIQAIENRVKSAQQEYEKTKPFLEKYNIISAEELRLACIKWVIQNGDMHTACIAPKTFDFAEKVISLSGTKLSQADIQFFKDYKLAYSDKYCRHACTTCAASCPSKVPVSTIMRYAYYYEGQGLEKMAMQKYAKLEGANALACELCDAPCNGSCPYGVNIQANMVQAHARLTLA